LANRITSIPAALAIVLDCSQLNRVGLPLSTVHQSAQANQQNIIYLIITLVIKGLPNALSGHLWRVSAASREGVPLAKASGVSLFMLLPSRSGRVPDFRSPVQCWPLPQSGLLAALSPNPSRSSHRLLPWPGEQYPCNWCDPVGLPF
jgi:hypothetical protein